MKLTMRAEIACDEHDDGKECLAVASYVADLTPDTAGFAKEASAHFVGLGWKLGEGRCFGFCFCPRHAAC